MVPKAIRPILQFILKEGFPHSISKVCHLSLTLGACARGTVVILCVCVSITALAGSYILVLYVENKVPLGFSW